MKHDFTTKDGVLSFLSSFWTQAFPDKGFVDGVGRIHAERAAQNYQDVIEAINTTSVRKTPLYHRESTVPLSLMESEMSEGPLPIQDGSGITYGSQSSGTIFKEGEIFEYGGSEKLAPFFYFDLPEAVTSLGSVITEKLVSPKTLLAKDRDFLTIEDRIIAFRENPFETGAFPVRSMTDGDRMIIAWASEVFSDRNYLHRRWGFPFFSDTISTEALREFCKTLFGLYASGPSVLMLDAFVAAMARQPVVAQAQETVEGVQTFNGERLIITDSSVYHTPVDVTLRSHVKVGQVLKAGSPLTTVTQVDDLISNPQWWETEGGLTLDSSLQSPKHFGGPIYFPNSEVLATTSGESARFDIAGSDEAIESFWRKVDEGSPENKYLGTELWKRYGVVGANGDADLASPLLINPMGFLVKDIFGVSLIGARVIAGQVPNINEFLDNLENLRRGTTPISLLVFFIDYELSAEYDPSGDTESVSLSMGLGIYEENLDMSAFKSTLNIKQSTAC